MPDEDSEPRPSARIYKVDDADGPDVDIRFDYQFPGVTVDTEARTATHDPIGDETVVQHLGEGDTTVDVQGSCYIDSANAIDKLTSTDRVFIRTDRFTGTAVVKSASTDPEGAVGGKDMSLTPNTRKHNWLYTYRIRTIGAVGGATGSTVVSSDADRELYDRAEQLESTQPSSDADRELEDAVGRQNLSTTRGDPDEVTDTDPQGGL